MSLQPVRERWGRIERRPAGDRPRHGAEGVFLVDTDVISETVRPSPNAAVMHWLADQAEVGLAAISLQEIAYGVGCAPVSKRALLEAWLDGLLRTEAIVIVPFGRDAAIETGWLLARCRHRGRGISREDAQIAGTARAGSMTLVTRNVADFRDLGLSLLNPFA